MKTILIRSGLLLVIGGIANEAFAATKTWDGGGGALNKNWSNATNWSGNLAPVAGDSLVFPAGTLIPKDTINDAPVGTDFTQIGIASAGYSLGGNSFDLTMLEAAGFSLDANFLSGVSTIGKGTIGIQGGDQKFRIGLKGSKPTLETEAINLNSNRLTAVVEGSLTVNGIISNSSGIPALRKDGGGTMFLEAANTYLGLTQVLDGTLVVNGSTAGGDISVAAGATLAGSGTVGGYINCSGIVSPGYSTTTGILTASGYLGLQLDSEASFRITGTTAGSSYDQIAAGGSVQLDSSAALTLTFGGYVPPAGTVFTLINKTSAGTIYRTFNGIPQGGVAIYDGVVVRFSYTGGDGNDFTATVCTTRTWDGGGADNNWMTAANWAGDVAPMAGDSLVFPAGAPADSLATVNNFPSDTAFITIQFTGGGYTVTPAVAGSNRVKLLQSLDDNHSGTANNWNNNILLGAAATVSTTGSGSLTISATIDNGDNPLTLHCDNATAAPLLTINGSITGYLGGLLKTGADAVRFSGATNNYAGGTTVQQGELQLQKSAGFAAIPYAMYVGAPQLVIGNGTLAASVTSTNSDQIAPGVTVTVNAGATYAPAANEYISGLILAAGATVNSGSATLTLSGDLTASGVGSSSIQGQLAMSGASHWTVSSGHVIQLNAVLNDGFSQSGDGRVVLAGTNAPTGIGIILNAGTLEVAGDNHNVGVALYGGVLTGTGTLRYVSAASPGGTLSPGPGILTCADSTRSLQLDNRVTVAVEIGGTTAGSGYDQLRTTSSGSISLDSPSSGAAKLAISFTGGFVPAIGNQFRILDNASSYTVQGRFEGLQEGQRFLVGSTMMQISYFGGTGNDVVLTCLEQPAQPLRVWDGGGGDGNWATAANWRDDVLPSAGDDLAFPVPLGGNLITTNNFPANTSFHTVSISHGQNTSTVTFSGNALVLTGGITNAAAIFGTTVWGIPVTLGADAVFENMGTPFDLNANVALGGHVATFRSADSFWGSFHFSGVISGAGALVKDGPGAVQFNGTSANTFSGATTVNAGTLVLYRSAATCVTGNLTIGNGTDTAAVNSNGELANTTALTVRANGSLSAGTDTVASITLNGGSVSGASLTVLGDVTLTAGTAAIGGTLVLPGSSGTIHQFDVAGGSTLTLNTVNQAASGIKLRKTGSGKLLLNGVATLGEAVIAGGTLQADSNSPSLPVKLDAVLGMLAGNGGVGTVTTATGGAILPGASPGDLSTGALSCNAATVVGMEITGTTAGSQYDQLVVTGSVVLGGASLSWSLGSGFVPLPGQEFVLIANDGSDAISGTFSGLPEGSLLPVAGGLKLQCSYHGGDGNDFSFKALPVTATGVTRVWDHGATVDGNWSNAMNWVGDVAPQPGDALVFPDQQVASSYCVNDFQAGTTFGSIQISGTSGFPYMPSGNRITLLGGLQVQSHPSISSFKIPLTLAADQTFVFQSNTYLAFGAESTIDLAGHALTLQNEMPTGYYVTFQGVISGAGGITQDGTGRTNLTATNTYTGDTVCRGGNIEGTMPGNLTVGGGVNTAWVSSYNVHLPNTATLAVLANGTYNAGDFASTDTIDNLVLQGGTVKFEFNGELWVNGDITISGTTPSKFTSDNNGGFLSLLGAVGSVHNLNVANGSLVTFAYGTKIRSLASGATLNKTGAGKVVFQNSNTVAGITCAAGEAVFQTSFGSSNSNVPVTLAGGTVSGDMQIGNLASEAAGGVVKPGLSLGRLTCKNVTWNAATTLAAELLNNTAATGYDQLKVYGTVNLGSAALSLTELSGYIPPIAQALVLIDNDGSDAITGTFAGLPEGAVMTLGQNAYRCSYVGGDGNDFTITPAVTPTGVTRVWSGNGANNLWSTAANWVGGVAPMLGDSIEFPAGAFRATNNNDYPVGFSFHQLRFSGATPYYLNGAALVLTGGIDAVSPSAVNHIVYAIPALGANQTISTDANSQVLLQWGTKLNGFTLTLASGNPLNGVRVSNNLEGTGNIVVDGSGKSVFAGNGFTWTGSTTIKRGILHLDAIASSANLRGSVTIGGFGWPATLEVASGAGLQSTCDVSINALGNLTATAGINWPVLHDLTADGGTVTANNCNLSILGDLILRGATLNGSGTLYACGMVAARGNAVSSIQQTLRATDVTGSERLLEVEYGSRLDLNGVVISDEFGTYYRKTGGGTVVFGAASNTLQRLIVTGGTARFNAANPVLPVFLDGGRLEGNGGCGALTSNATGGTVAPGTSAGAFTTGNLTWNAATVLAIELGGTTGGSSHDQVRVTGTVNLGGSMLQASLIGGFVPNQSSNLVILQNDGSDSITGTFASLPEGTLFPMAGQTLRITYQGGDGNDVALISSGTPWFSTFTVTPARSAGTDNVDAVFSGTVRGGVPGVSALLQASSTLQPGSWTVIGTAVFDAAGSASFIAVTDPGTGLDPVARARRFYRITVVAE